MILMLLSQIHQFSSGEHVGISGLRILWLFGKEGLIYLWHPLLFQEVKWRLMHQVPQVYTLKTFILFVVGILKETAVKLVLSAQSLKTEVEREQFIKEGLELCLKSGLTGVQTNDDHSFETYRDLSKSGNGLPLRVFLTPLHEEIVKGTSFKSLRKK